MFIEKAEENRHYGVQARVPYSWDSRVAEATCLSTGREKFGKPVVASDYGFFC
jgi:hypothetical protein